jgi:NDP-sugar pyrophosphorylase family protein
MKAVILAAGRGSRLAPLTDRCPKPMIPIGGKPLLEHIVRLLTAHGFDQLFINLHHLPEQISEYFGDGSQWGASINYSREEHLLGTAGAVKNIFSSTNEPILVYYGDNLCNVDIGALWRQHLKTQAWATIGLLWMDDPTTRGIVGLQADGRIDRLIEKPKPEQVFADYQVNGGIYALDPAILPHIPPGPCDFAADIFPPLLEADHPLYGHRLQGQLLSTDTPQRYAAACDQVNDGSFALP